MSWRVPRAPGEEFPRHRGSSLLEASRDPQEKHKHPGNRCIPAQGSDISTVPGNISVKIYICGHKLMHMMI
jgi:hypothetical protein